MDKIELLRLRTDLKQANNVIIILFALWIFTAIMLLVFIGTLTKKPTFDTGYKQGQIDALNGIQNWDKVATKDTIYIKIK